MCRIIESGLEELARSTEASMKNEYDLFEKSPNDSSLWRGAFPEFETTCLRLQELAQISGNPFYAISFTTGEVLAFTSQGLDLFALPKFARQPAEFSYRLQTLHGQKPKARPTIQLPFRILLVPANCTSKLKINVLEPRTHAICCSEE
jgi:hypothetical protein